MNPHTNPHARQRLAEFSAAQPRKPLTVDDVLRDFPRAPKPPDVRCPLCRQRWPVAGFKIGMDHKEPRAGDRPPMMPPQDVVWIVCGNPDCGERWGADVSDVPGLVDELLEAERRQRRHQDELSRLSRQRMDAAIAAVKMEGLR